MGQVVKIMFVYLRPLKKHFIRWCKIVSCYNHSNCYAPKSSV